MRTEEDALGLLELPEKSYYGIQTERAIQNFNISRETIGDHPSFLWSLACIKKAAALSNRDLHLLEEEVASAIVQASSEVMDGSMIEEFPIDVFQGGGGTSTNMNMNEVLANRANEIITGKKGYTRVHPNTHVNMCQSTNDVIPSALKMTSYRKLQELALVLGSLIKTIKDRARDFQRVVKVGRTCLQDALPITLGQEWSGYYHLLERHGKKIDLLKEDSLSLPLGATAVGTSLGLYPGYIERVFSTLFSITEIPFVKSTNLFDGLQNGDDFLALSSFLKSLASGLSKISRDLILLSSGPRAGLSEIVLPPVQPGSSIMPGKINPVIPMMMNQVCYQVCGNDVAITMAVEGGELDLNVWGPVILKSLMESFDLLIKSIPLLEEKCIAGIKANEDICREYATSSVALSTVISSLFGYEEGSRVARLALERGSSVREVSVELGLLTEEEAGRLLDPEVLTDPKKSGEYLFFKENQ